MNFSDSRYKRLKNLFDNSQDVFVIHWSRQNLTDNEGGVSTPRIVGIIVRSLDGAITKTFAIHLEAEKAGFTSEDIDTYYDQLEERVLRDFVDFAKQYSTNTWVHWDSDDPHIGFEAISHRYEVLLNKGSEEGQQDEVQDIFEIPVQNRVNLNSCLKEIYGSNYEKRPQLQNLIKSNNDGDCELEVSLKKLDTNYTLKKTLFYKDIDMKLIKDEFLNILCGLKDTYDIKKTRFQVTVDNKISSQNDSKSFTFNYMKDLNQVFEDIKTYLIKEAEKINNSDIEFSNQKNISTTHYIRIFPAGSNKRRKGQEKCFSIYIPNYSSKEIIKILKGENDAE